MLQQASRGADDDVCAVDPLRLVLQILQGAVRRHVSSPASRLDSQPKRSLCNPDRGI